MSINNGLLELIKLAIKESVSIDEAIALSVVYGKCAASKHVYLYDGGGVELLFIGRFMSEFQLGGKIPTRETIHVVSQTVSYGGHTKLMEQLACMEDVQPDVLITQNDNAGYNIKHAAFDKVYTLFQEENENKLREMVALLSNYKQVVLHILPHDFVASIAARLIKNNTGAKVFFVNHADHVFSFGRSAAHCVLQVSAFGEILTRRHDKNIPSSFIGIPINSENEVRFDLVSLKQRTLLTVGSGWKFKPRLKNSLPRLMMALLAQDKKVRLLVVGANPIKDYWWWPLKMFHPKRVFIYRPLPYIKYNEIRTTCSMIVDSYPIPGGTAFPEAILSGKLAFGLTTPMCGYSPADKLRKSSYKFILEIFENPYRYLDELQEAIPKLKDVHGIDSVRRRYRLSLKGDMQPNPLLSDFSGNVDFLREYNETRKFKAIRFALSLPSIIPIGVMASLGMTLMRQRLKSIWV